MNTPDRNMAFYGFDSRCAIHRRLRCPHAGRRWPDLASRSLRNRSGVIWLVVHFATVAAFAGRNTHVCYLATGGLTDEEIEANAALIAQAPALLGLAQGYRAYLIRNGAEDDGLLRIVLETVDAILAKAAPSC